MVGCCNEFDCGCFCVFLLGYNYGDGIMGLKIALTGLLMATGSLFLRLICEEDMDKNSTLILVIVFSSFFSGSVMAFVGVFMCIWGL